MIEHNDRILFRWATLEDIDSIFTLVHKAYRGDSSKKGWTTEADIIDGPRTDKDELKQKILSTDSKILLGFDLTSKVLSGCCLLTWQPKDKLLYFGMFAIDPEIQNLGMGKLFLEKSEAYGLEIGALKIEMSVIECRHELILYYKRRGFIKTSRRINFPDDQRNGTPKIKDLKMIILEKLIAPTNQKKS